MIEVHADVRSGYLRLAIDGHHPPHEGEISLPCAAVSTIVQVVLAALQVVERQYPEAIRLHIDYRRE